MASRTFVQLIDDVDGSEASETITFALDGTTYEIDLNGDHAEELRASIDKYATVGRRIGGKSTRPARAATTNASAGKVVKSPATGGVDPGVIRAWAAEQGIKVGDKGRIKKEIVDQYHAAH